MITLHIFCLLLRFDKDKVDEIKWFRKYFHFENILLFVASEVNLFLLLLFFSLRKEIIIRTCSHLTKTYILFSHIYICLHLARSTETTMYQIFDIIPCFIFRYLYIVWLWKNFGEMSFLEDFLIIMQIRYTFIVYKY